MNIIYITSLLGPFGPIFYFNCEHVLFVYIVKENKKSSRILTKKFWISNFQRLDENLILMGTNIQKFDH